MKPEDFVHLHVHSHFSLLDGACLIPSLAGLAKEHGMKALALTDHGNLFGAIQFQKGMSSAGIKPILGFEAYVAPASRFDKSPAMKQSNHHLTLLAKDVQGYHNLVKLSSIGYLEGFYYKPRIDLEVLEKHKEGIIALSGCNSSELCHFLLAGRDKDALAAAMRYRDILGADNYFVEMQDNGLEDQKNCLEGLARVAREAGLGMVATNDIHYGRKEDAAVQEVLLCINTGKTMADPDRMRFGSSEFYFKSGQEMIERFGRFEGAVENTAAIAERCNVKLDYGQRHFPAFVPPDGMTDVQYLRKLCEEGLRRRFGAPSAEQKDRLDYELKIVDEMGYSSYFLIVWDIVNFARARRIPLGLRGSGNSAIVCYTLGISDVDPIRYSLIFERFLDRERREPPDLDIDICEVRREEVIRYLRDKYGHDQTAMIITFGTMKAKAVVKDVARALGWSVAEANDLTKRIPSDLGTTLKAALEKDETLRNDKKSNPRIRDLLGYAEKLEGLARHASTHAAGVCIADRPLTQHIPICKINDIVMTQFAMADLEKAGMLKMDLLGLRTLTIVDKALTLIEQRTGKLLDLEQIPFDDQPTYDLMGRGDTKAVFQLGSSGIQDLLRKLKPENIEDVIAIVALYRPGPLQSGMIDDFVARRHGEKEITYTHPSLEPILKDTCGVIVYQEQIMRILHQLGGLSLGDALSTIKAISKKKSEEIESRHEAFLSGSKEKGISKSVAEAIFDLIRKFAQYGFNRSHTTPYAFLAYRTAWLKAHYPMEFAAADLTCEMNHSDKLKEHIRDGVQMGLRILPPDINEGQADFSVVTVKDEKGAPQEAIRFGMAGVKNVGGKAVESVIEARKEKGPFTSIFNFCERVPSQSINRSAIETLIKAGAFDSLPGNRAQKVAALEGALGIGARAQRDRRRGQKSLFGGVSEGEIIEPALPPVPEWGLAEKGRYEKEALGLRLSFNPLARYASLLSQLTTADSATLKEKAADAAVIVAGEIAEVRSMMTKHGRAMAQVQLEDLAGVIKCVAFPEVFERCAAQLKEDNIVFIIATVDGSSERPGIQIREVFPVAEGASRLTETVQVQLSAAAVDGALLDKLRDVFSRYPGDRQLFLDVAMPDASRVRVRAGRGFFVRPSAELARDITGLLGPGCLRFHPRPPVVAPTKWAGRGNGNGNGGR